jgi:hypothetical protein
VEARCAELVGVLSAVIELVLDNCAEAPIVESLEARSVKRDDEVGNDVEPLLELLFALSLLPRAASVSLRVFSLAEDPALLFPIGLVRPQDTELRELEMLVIWIVQRARRVEEGRPDLRLHFGRWDKRVARYFVDVRRRVRAKARRIPARESLGRTFEADNIRLWWCRRCHVATLRLRSLTL